MKVHSREWFLDQIARAKKDIKTWPKWMQEGRKMAAAFFPVVGKPSTKGTKK